MPTRHDLSNFYMQTMVIRRLSLALALWVGMAAVARADFPAAVAAYDQGDYATTFAESQPLAERGDAEAQYMLGFLYARGEGVGRDLIHAFLWFSLAAWQGDEIAADALVELSRRMTSKEIAAAETLARRWVPVSE